VPPLEHNRCRSFRKSKLCRRALIAPDVRYKVQQAVNLIGFISYELRLCNDAQNEANIKSDDRDYDKSCTADIHYATRIINCL
jgi:hypothetical protein